MAVFSGLYSGQSEITLLRMKYWVHEDCSNSVDFSDIEFLPLKYSDMKRLKGDLATKRIGLRRLFQIFGDFDL